MNIINTIAIAALTGLLFQGLAFNSNAQTTATISERSVSEKLNIQEVKPMQFKVSYHTPQSKSITVRILDTDKNVLFNESKRTDVNYVKYFDLTSLLDGTYTFEIMDGKEKFSQSFDVLTKTSRVVSAIKK